MVIGFDADNVWKAKKRGFQMGVVQSEGVTVHLTGQVAWDRDENIVGKGDIQTQSRQCFKNIEMLLNKVGGRIDDIVSVTTYYTDSSQLSAIQKVRKEFFQDGLEPVSTSVMVAGLGHKDFLVEFTPVAVIPRSRFVRNNKEQWQIRRGANNDAKSLETCIAKSYSIYAADIPDMPAVAEGVAQDIQDNIVWVATLHDKIIAGLVLIENDDHVTLANIAVDPDCTGMGLGRALIELSEQETLRLGKNELRLSTHTAMPKNVELYQHLGWQETKRTKHKVYMTKFLAP